MHDHGQAAAEEIRIVRDLFAWLRQHSARYFGEHFAGSLAHRINEGTIGLLEITWLLIVEMLPIVAVLVTSLVMLTLASPWLGLGLLVWVTAYTWLAYRLSLKAQKLAGKHATARSLTTGKIVDAVGNLNSIRLFARQDYRHQLSEPLPDRGKTGRTTLVLLPGKGPHAAGQPGHCVIFQFQKLNT